MKHESIVVVYDSCQAIAEVIADKLGAETVSVQSMNVRQIENSQSLVLAVEFQDGGNLSPHWQYAVQMFRCASLRGKNLAVMVAHGNRGDNSIYTDAFCRELRENGAHIVGDYLYADAPTCNLSRSTSYRSNSFYKTIITMQYIFIVALEFVLAFIGVALLIRYYNHKA